MKLRSLTIPLAATLLLSTLGCSKKEDATPATTWGNGNYKLDGISRNCTVKATLTNFASNGNRPAYDYLQLFLPTENATSQEYLLLEFNKLASQPATAYTLVTMAYFPTGTGTGTLYDNDVTTLAATSNGSFSGTFSGKITTTTSGTTTTHTITNGTFTGVHP